MSATILLVEDNPHHMKINSEALSMKGYKTLEADTLAKGRKLFLEHAPDLILLDIMLPDGNGLELCEELRRGSDVPILFLSAKKEDEDVLKGLDIGGDDYLTKPYSINILVKRVENALEKSRRVPDKLIKGRLVLDLLSNTVTYDDVDLEIKGRAFDVLFFLAKRENQIFTSAQIYEKVWNQPMLGDDGSIRTVIKTARNKLENTDYTISTEHGKGYTFERG